MWGRKGGEKIPRLLLFEPPVSDGVERPKSLCSDFAFRSRKGLAFDDRQSFLNLPRPLFVLLMEQGIFCGANDKVSTALLRKITQEVDVIVLPITEKEYILSFSEQLLGLFCESHVFFGTPVAFFSLLNLPCQRKKATFVEETEH